MLNVTPIELQIMWENVNKAHCKIRDAKNDAEYKSAQSKFKKMQDLHNKIRYEKAFELLFRVNGSDAIAVLYSRKHGYGVTIVTGARDGFEHLGPYKTEENAMRYAMRKYDIDFSNPIAKSCYECGTDDAYNMINNETEKAMCLMRDEIIEEEGNCEDSVNCLAYEAYQLVYGETLMSEMDIEKMDNLLKIARKHVRSNAKFHGVEWEEF